jgi:signal transduction histidine kinase
VTTLAPPGSLTASMSRFVLGRALWPTAALIAALMLGAGEWSFREASRAMQDIASVQSARLVLEQVRIDSSAVELAQRSLLRSGDEAFRADYRSAVARVRAHFGALQVRYASRDLQVRSLFDRAKSAFEQRLSDLDRRQRLADDGQRAEAVAALDAEVASPSQTATDPLLSRLADRETRWLEGAAAAQRAGMNRARAILLAMLLFGMVSIELLRQQSKRLHRADKARSQLLESERARLEDAVDRRTRDLRALTGYMISTREDERAFIARELHDELGSLLTAAKLDLARLKSKVPATPEMQAQIAQLAAGINDGISLKSRIIEDLRPSSLSTLGLVATLRALCETTELRLGVPVQATLDDNVTLTGDVALTIYRFVQESLTNAAKYAKANMIHVTLSSTATTTSIEVSDDGEGFDVAAKLVGQHGLAGMRFRVESLGGTMSIESRPGDTKLVATLPKKAGALETTVAPRADRTVSMQASGPRAAADAAPSTS